MPRKKPFSCKQKKQQLRENRLRKQDGPAYLEDSSDGEENVASSCHRQEGGGDHGSTAQTRQGQVLKIHQQPKLGDSSKLDANRLHFFKESDEVINRKRKEARKPVKPVGEQQLEYKLEDAYPPGAKLDFPKRPPWSYILTKDQLDQQEKQYFDTYVSDILDQPRIQDLSYFELNLETWRQLWRVLEITDILLIIADIRYPVLQVSPSLISHILQDLHKQVVIVLNKVDFVPPVIALAWKRYLHTVFPGIHVVFFSSFPREPVSEDDPVNFDPSKSLYKRKFQGKFVPVGPAQLLDVCKEIVGDRVDLSSWEEKLSDSSLAQTEEGKTTNQGTLKDPGSQTESSNDQPSYTKYKNGILSIGCIGYPNAGKSSVLNALVGRKVVSVSKTPGHTKHFQTIFLTPTVKLCDCPGLVFPSMVPKSLQVLAGIFPVAQVREPFSVVGYLAKRLDLPKLLRLAPLGSGYKGREWSWSAYDICDDDQIRFVQSTMRGAGLRLFWCPGSKTFLGCHSVEDFNCLNPVHEDIEWCIMLKDKRTEEIVALKRLKMEKKKGFPITSLREINTVLKGQHENIVKVRGCHNVQDFNCLNPVHECIGWCIMLKDKKTAKIVALKRLKMEKEKGFPITSLREINTVLKGGHENIVTVRGCRRVEDFNYLNPVHKHIEWCIMLKDKTEEIVALKRLKMEKEEGFPFTSLREINTVFKGQHENIVTVKGCRRVEDFNCLNPVHKHIGWCIMLNDKTEKIVALKRLKMEKEEGFPITSLREINRLLKVQHENVVTLKGCRSVEDFNCLNSVHEHIEWCIVLKDKKT